MKLGKSNTYYHFNYILMATEAGFHSKGLMRKGESSYMFVWTNGQMENDQICLSSQEG